MPVTGTWRVLDVRRLTLLLPPVRSPSPIDGMLMERARRLSEMRRPRVKPDIACRRPLMAVEWPQCPCLVSVLLPLLLLMRVLLLLLVCGIARLRRIRARVAPAIKCIPLLTVRRARSSPVPVAVHAAAGAQGRRGGTHDHLGLGGECLDEDAMGLEDSLLDETGHEEITANLDVLAQIQALARGSEAELDGLLGLSRQRAAQRPALADVGAHGGVAVRLQAVGPVLERGRVRQVRLDARHVADLVRHAPPDAVRLVGGRVRRRRDRVPLDHQRVQADHLGVVVQEVEHHLARDPRRQRRDGREGRAFRHCCLFRERVLFVRSGSERACKTRNRPGSSWKRRIN